MAETLRIGDIRGKNGPLAEITLQDSGTVALQIKRPPRGDLVVVMNLAQALRLSELLCAAVDRAAPSPKEPKL